MANIYYGLLVKLIYWKNDVIRYDVIFDDVTRCSMTTIFLWWLSLDFIFYHSFVIDTQESILILWVYEEAL